MAGIREYIARIFGSQLTETEHNPIDKLVELLLQRACAAGADRLSFGTPPNQQVMAPCSVPAVAVWFQRNEGWTFFEYLPAGLLSGLIQSLQDRLGGLPSPWSSEGRALQIELDGSPKNIQVRLGIEPQGAFVVDLLSHR